MFCSSFLLVMDKIKKAQTEFLTDRSKAEGSYYICLFTISDQVTQQSAPLSPELVCSGQTAVASNHAQVGDAQLHQVVCCLHTTLPTSEVLAAGTADNSASLRRGEKTLSLTQSY